MTKLTFLYFICFRYKAGHQAICDGGTNPYFNEHIICVLIDRLNEYVVVIECGNDYIDDTNHPEVALGVRLPILAGIEECKHEE